MPCHLFQFTNYQLVKNFLYQNSLRLSHLYYCFDIKADFSVSKANQSKQRFRQCKRSYINNTAFSITNGPAINDITNRAQIPFSENRARSRVKYNTDWFSLFRRNFICSPILIFIFQITFLFQMIIECCHCS